VADVSVRPARAGDAAEVARVQLSTWRTAYADLLPPDALALDEADVAAAWRRAVEAPPSPRHRLLVALERTQVVGLAATAPADHDDGGPGGTAEVTALLVEPRWGRRGHGSRLLAALVDGWRADGVARAVAWAWERDASTRGLLTAAGWEPDGAARGLDTGARVQRQVRLHVAL
jgi:GNAT superfamily N-acetyltransferase